MKAEDGFIYDRRFIQQWIDECERDHKPVTSPMKKIPKHPDNPRSKEKVGAPMGKTLLPDAGLKAEIDQFLRGLISPSTTVSADALVTAATEDAPSVRMLNRIFSVMDELQDLLQEVLRGWEAPFVTVIGAENTGKSTILERLCMIPMFPHDNRICTRMAVRVSIRRSAASLPPTLEVWSTRTNERVGNAQIVPLTSGSHAVRDTMARLLQGIDRDRGDGGVGNDGDIDTDHELRVSIVSPDLPPMNLLDLPGMVQAPDRLKAKSRELVERHVEAVKGRAMFLAIVPAHDNPNVSMAMSVVEAHGLEGNTIGVFTKADRVEPGDPTFDLLDRLENKKQHGIPLEPHGYVVTVNKPWGNPRGQSPLQQLHVQAAQEKEFFLNPPEDFGGRNLMEENLAGTQALVSKIGTMYTEFVRTTWLPSTVSKLMEERSNADRKHTDLGLPFEGPDEVQEAFFAHTATLVKACRDGALEYFVENVLKGVELQLQRLLGDERTMSLADLEAETRRLRSTIVEDCDRKIKSIQGTWAADVDRILADNALPFRLQRYPRSVRALAEYLKRHPPTMGKSTLRSIDKFLEYALSLTSPWMSIAHDLNAQPPHATVRFDVQKVASRVLVILSGGEDCGFRPPGGTDAAMRNHVAPIIASEQESCHRQRQEIALRKKHIDTAVRKLISVVGDSGEALNHDVPLEDLVHQGEWMLAVDDRVLIVLAMFFVFLCFQY